MRSGSWVVEDRIAAHCPNCKWTDFGAPIVGLAQTGKLRCWDCGGEVGIYYVPFRSGGLPAGVHAEEAGQEEEMRSLRRWVWPQQSGRDIWGTSGSTNPASLMRSDSVEKNVSPSKKLPVDPPHPMQSNVEPRSLAETYRDLRRLQLSKEIARTAFAEAKPRRKA